MCCLAIELLTIYDSIYLALFNPTLLSVDGVPCSLLLNLPARVSPVLAGHTWRGGQILR